MMVHLAPFRHIVLASFFILLFVCMSAAPVLADTVSVTATTPAEISDFSDAIATTALSSQFAQNTEVTYQITYASTLNTPTNVTVSADWTQGTISGASTPSVDILQYVTGSATNAYGNTPAVIDTVNRTITWSIPSLPSNSGDQTVSFSLETTSAYTGSSPVSFTVDANFAGPGVTLPVQSITQSYLYAPSSTSGSSSSTSSTSSSSTSTTSTAASPVTTVTPIATSPAAKIAIVAVQSVGSTSATVRIGTNIPAGVTLYYGTDKLHLSQSLTDTDTKTSRHTFTLNNLLPATTYYFVPIITGSPLRTTGTLYTFTTATTATKPALDENSIVITSQHTVLYSFGDLRDQSGLPLVVLQPDNPYELTFRLNPSNTIASVRALVEDTKVLAWEDPAPDTAGQTEVAIPEISQGKFTSKLLAPTNPGTYIVSVQVIDYYGNIIEQPLVSLVVSTPFTVLDKHSGQPIENAAVTLSYYNPDKRLFELLPTQIFSWSNPLYTSPNGRITYALPIGTYRAKVTALGYQSTEQQFTITGTSTNQYPIIQLTPTALSVFNVISYYTTTIISACTSLAAHGQLFALSPTNFVLFSQISVVLFGFILLLVFAQKLDIPFMELPGYGWYYCKRRFTKQPNQALFGTVFDTKTKKPVSAAYITVIDAEKNAILTRIKTDLFGYFTVPPQRAKSLKVVANKPGYLAQPYQEYTAEEAGSAVFLFLEPEHTAASARIIRVCRELGLGLFGVVLVMLCYAEGLFIQSLGFWKIAPFLLPLMLTVLLWGYYTIRVNRLRRYHMTVSNS